MAFASRPAASLPRAGVFETVARSPCRPSPRAEDDFRHGQKAPSPAVVGHASAGRSGGLDARARASAAHPIRPADQSGAPGRGGPRPPSAGGRPCPATAFHSILSDRPEEEPTGAPPERPTFFTDLNLDQIVDAVTAGKQEYDLSPFFYASPADIGTIRYRQEVFKDLENSRTLDCVNQFAQSMRIMREHLAKADKLYYKLQKQAWFMDAVALYCDGVRCLLEGLQRADLRSRGLLSFRAYLARYVGASRFTSLNTETEKLKADLATIRYGVLIKGASITVRRYESEIDYSAAVEATFRKFKEGAVKNYSAKFIVSSDMNHIEAGILEFVARLYPTIFHDITRHSPDAVRRDSIGLGPQPACEISHTGDHFRPAAPSNEWRP